MCQLVTKVDSLKDITSDNQQVIMVQSHVIYHFSDL